MIQSSWKEESGGIKTDDLIQENNGPSVLSIVSTAPQNDGLTDLPDCNDTETYLTELFEIIYSNIDNI